MTKERNQNRAWKVIVRYLLNRPGLALFVVFGLSAISFPLFPELFFSNSIGMVAGIGFTMLGFGLAATSILTSVISTPTVVRLRSSEAWSELTTTFTRSNLIFLVLGLFGLFVYKELFADDTVCGVLLRAAYLGTLGVSVVTAITIIYVLHRIVEAPLTPEEQKTAEELGMPAFAPPAASEESAPEQETETVVVGIQDN